MTNEELATQTAEKIIQHTRAVLEYGDAFALDDSSKALQEIILEALQTALAQSNEKIKKLKEDINKLFI